MRQALRLQLDHIAEQCTGCTHCRRVVGGEAEAIERSEVEPAGEFFGGEAGIELPALARRAQDPLFERDVALLRHNHFGGCEPAERLGEPVGGDGLEQKLSGRKIEGRHAAGGFANGHRDQPVVAGARSPVFVEKGTRSDRLDHGALDNPLGEPGVLHLLTDRDAKALRDELPQIAGGGLDRDTRERDAVAACGQRDVQRARSDLRVLVEHLVEIAHPEEEDRVGVTRLDLPVLGEERRSSGIGHGTCYGTRTTNGAPPRVAFSAFSFATAASRLLNGPACTLMSPRGPAT